MLEKIQQWLEPLQRHVPKVLFAIGLFIVGWILCKIISGSLAMAMRKFQLDDKLNSKDSKLSINAEKIIEKFVYYLLLIYVILISLSSLGIKDVLDPIISMCQTVFGSLPNIVAALFIAFLGYIIAKVLEQIVKSATVGLDPLTSKAGISDKLTISKLLGQLTFIFTFIPILVAALEKLKIKAISDPAIAMIEELASVIPNIIGAAVVLIIFYIIGKFITNFLAEFIKNLGADDIPNKIGAANLFGKKSFSIFCGHLLFFFIMLFGSTTAISTLELPQITGILLELLEFSGQVVLGLIVLGIGNYIATLAADTLSKATNGGIYPVIVRVAILALVLAMGLHTMDIAADIVEMAFLFIFGTLGLTIILAFGLGGRDAAGKCMENWLKKFDK